MNNQQIEQKLTSVVKSCKTMEQLSTTKRWIKSLKVDATVQMEMIAQVSIQQAVILKAEYANRPKFSLKNVTAHLLGHQTFN